MVSVFSTDNKIWTCEGKSEFWKPCIHYLEADNFPRLKEFSNEIGSNVSKCDFFDTV